MEAASEEELAFAGSRSTELSRLRQQLSQLRHENEALKRQAFEAMSDSEKSQEQISNRLIRQIDQMRRERAELVNAVEAEEEYLTNVLQKRLEAVQRQRDQLEDTLESDREAIIGRLQSQIDTLILKAGDATNAAALEQLKGEVSSLRQKSFQRESERITLEFSHESSAMHGRSPAIGEPAASTGEYAAEPASPSQLH